MVHFSMALMLVLDRLGGVANIDDGNQVDPVVENDVSFFICYEHFPGIWI